MKVHIRALGIGSAVGADLSSTYYTARLNTFYPFQNKHQIHRHLQSVKMLCTYKNKNKLKLMKSARLT